VDWETRRAIVEQYYEALERGDRDAVYARLAEGVVTDWSRSRGPHSGIYEGKAGSQKFVEEFFTAWAEIEFITEGYLPAGTGVIRVGGFRGVGAGSGVPIEATGAQLVEVSDDGLIQRITLFQSADEALEAAGANDS
jgi:ketosteroid isomerase-like protein